LTQDESSYVVDAEYGVGGKNKVTHVTWFSFGTVQLFYANTDDNVLFQLYFMSCEPLKYSTTYKVI